MRAPDDLTIHRRGWWPVATGILGGITGLVTLFCAWMLGSLAVAFVQPGGGDFLLVLLILAPLLVPAMLVSTVVTFACLKSLMESRS